MQPWLVLFSLLPPPEPPPEQIELNWAAPAGCPSASDVLEATQRLLPEQREGAGVLLARGVVTKQSAKHWELTLETEFHGAFDARTIEGRSCRDLGEATAALFAISLEFGVEAMVRAPSPAPQPAEPARPAIPAPPTPSEAPQVSTARGPSKAPARPPRPPRPPRVRVGPQASLSMGLEYGNVPGLAGRAALALGPRWRLVSAAAELSYTTPRTAAADGVEVAAQHLGGAVRGCGVPAAGPVEFPLCAGLEAGLLTARVRGANRDRVRGPTLAPVVRVGVMGRRATLRPVFTLEAAFGALQTDIRLDQVTLFRSAPISVRAMVGFAFSRLTGP